MVSTFATIGVGSTNVNLFSFFNKTGSGVLVAIREFDVNSLRTGDSGTVRTPSLSQLTTAPSTGTLLTKVAFDTTLSSSANVEARGATADDNAAATTLTATPTTYGWRIFGARGTTGAGQTLEIDQTLSPSLSETDDPMILRESEGVLVTIPETGSSGATYLVRVMFEEFKYAVIAAGPRIVRQAVNRSTF